jgi:alpha-L-rhamnosidase
MGHALVFMAHADWMHTGDTRWLAPRYEALKSKLLLERTRADGLITSNAAQIRKGDLVDWPAAERDGFVFTPVNTVVNAFHLRGLTLMADLARALGRDDDAAGYPPRAGHPHAAFHRDLFDSFRGVYRDGEGTDHASQHANLFPLAFGLVPDAERPRVTAFVTSRGMACSVYAAQYLMEALIRIRRRRRRPRPDRRTRRPQLAPHGRERHDDHLGSLGPEIQTQPGLEPRLGRRTGEPVSTLRARCDQRPSRPAGAAPAIRPHPGPLAHAEGKIPTPRGPILVDWKQASTFQLTVELPPGMSARVELPAPAGSSGVYRSEISLPANRVGDRWVVRGLVSGRETLEVR